MAMSVHPAIDVIRVLGIGSIFCSIGFMFGWLIHYWRLYGFPRCVWLLAISYTLYAIGSIIEIQLRIGEPVTWRTPLLIAAAATGLVAQILAYHTWGRFGRMPIHNRRHGDFQ